ncbi:MAG: hypothetical protein L6R40_008364 [Gallowayella cf. fulva]|nr:MAG: hypothetical protein L6R40_008364 [Xanthomendoza cf. fulva]
MAQPTSRPLSAIRHLIRSKFPIPTPRRTYHTTPSLAAGSLFNTGGLSHSREAQYFSKERGIPRTEFASHIALIDSSEVAPYATKPEKKGNGQMIEGEAGKKESGHERGGREAPLAPGDTITTLTSAMKDLIRDVAMLRRALQTAQEAQRTHEEKTDKDKTLIFALMALIANTLAISLCTLDTTVRDADGKIIATLGWLPYMLCLFSDRGEHRFEEAATVVRAAQQGADEYWRSSSPSLVDGQSEQNGNDKRHQELHEATATPAAEFHHVSRSEWDCLLRSVDLLLDTDLRKDKNESFKEVPASSWRKWFWSS